jgi:hypothetical protein
MAVFAGPSLSDARSQTVAVSGTFGDQGVVGSASATEDADGALNVKAKFTVLPSEPNSLP